MFSNKPKLILLSFIFFSFICHSNSFNFLLIEVFSSFKSKLLILFLSARENNVIFKFDILSFKASFSDSNSSLDFAGAAAGADNGPQVLQVAPAVAAQAQAAAAHFAGAEGLVDSSINKSITCATLIFSTFFGKSFQSLSIHLL